MLDVHKVIELVGDSLDDSRADGMFDCLLSSYSSQLLHTVNIFIVG